MIDSNASEQPKSFFSFLKKLLLARWQSLLVLLLGVIVPLLVFEQLAVVIWQNKGAFSWDDAILLALHARSTPKLDTFALHFTQLGVYWGVIPAIGAILIVLLYLRKWRSLTFLLVATLGSGFINRVAKEWLHRVRPHLWETLTPEFSYGFPSGHAMASMSFVAAIVILAWGTRWFWFVLLAGGCFVATIGWTRLYLGVHFPSDILAGWMVALAWTIVVSLVIRPHLVKPTLVSEEALTIEEEKATISAP